MLFNKSSNGATELKKVTGNYYKSNDFNRIETDVILQEEEIIKIIGQDVYDLAQAHYDSSNYNTGAIKTDPDASGSGSGSGTGTGVNQLWLLDQLVQHIQIPVGILATLEYYKRNDISHEDTGRKVKIDSAVEKLPWEWMYDRDEAASLKMGNRTIDRLINFLDTYEDYIDEWKESEYKTLSRSLFINNADTFDGCFPIDKSRVFYSKLIPIQKKNELVFIKTALGEDDYEDFKEAIIDNTLDAGQQQKLIYIQNAIAWLTMAEAVKVFSLQALPEGVVKTYFSMMLTRKASETVQFDQAVKVSETIKKTGNEWLNQLKKLIMADSDETSEVTVMPTNSEDNKYMRT